jgi:ATP-binding cassette subfamily B protein
MEPKICPRKPENMNLTLGQFLVIFIRKQWVLFLVTSIAGLGWAVDQVYFPVLFGRVVDGFIHYEGDRTQAWSVLGNPIFACFVLWTVLEVFYRLAGFCMARLTPRMIAHVRLFFVEHLQKQSHRFFVEHQAGNVANKVADIATSTEELLNVWVYCFLPCGVGIILAGFVFYAVQPLFAVFVVTWALVHLAIAMGGNRYAAVLSQTHAGTRSHLVGYIIDTVTNYLTVKVFARRTYEQKHITHMQVEEEAQKRRLMLYIEYVKIFLGLWSFVGLGLAINGYAYYCWKHHLISVGDVVVIFQASWGMGHLVWYAGMEIPSLFKHIGVVNQAISLLNVPVEVLDKPDAKPLTVTQGQITFDKVCFGYQGQSTLLFDHLSLSIKPGEKVGLVGFSGGGKTSFMHLLLRLYDVQNGRICIDGQDIATVTQESLHQAIAVIPQDPILFHRTVGENMAYGKPGATAADVHAAAKAANAHTFISALEKGYDTLVGERGVKLSGGQRQRIAIARAILKEAPILIMDEATSALDSVTEAYIQDNMRHFTQGCTTLVVAHRLSTLLNMDRIVVFDKGRLMEEGTHEALLAQNGLYKQLWDAQISGFLPG